MRFIFCGDRHWNDPQIVEWQMQQIRNQFGCDDVTIVHGAARGLDGMAGAIGRRFGFDVEPEPALWDRYGKRSAGAVRNAKMLDSGVDAIFGYKNGFDLGFHKGGTEMMIEMGLLNEIPVEVWHYVGGDVVPGGYAKYDIVWPLPDPWGTRRTATV